MDVFIPEEYVVKRRLEKKTAAAAASSSSSSSKSHSHRKSGATDKKASFSVLSNSKAFGFVGDNDVFTYFSA
ncbi:hypothetical protein SESBI_20887 [Sesbania bispinosa]|nr:hypothetical protein SESBI_20887 [Sesbania bispinosa]